MKHCVRSVKLATAKASRSRSEALCSSGATRLLSRYDSGGWNSVSAIASNIIQAYFVHTPLLATFSSANISCSMHFSVSAFARKGSLLATNRAKASRGGSPMRACTCGRPASGVITSPSQVPSWTSTLESCRDRRTATMPSKRHSRSPGHITTSHSSSSTSLRSSAASVSLIWRCERVEWLSRSEREASDMSFRGNSRMFMMTASCSTATRMSLRSSSGVLLHKATSAAL
mmetsp:Transcript_24981/g.68263  ORF Transcript_24981/g.68263 Transcript_24981/m.68263 type:complete len:230 (-) Transcript_24981:17-706(-)